MKNSSSNRIRLPGRQIVQLVVVASVVGCDIPTEMPDWDTRWVLPAEATRLPLEEILPEEISRNAAGDGFLVTLPEFSAASSLREICPECAPLDGITIPKPPFTLSLTDELQISEWIVSGEVDGGSVEVRLQHDFDFDPLRPGGAGVGYLVLRLRSGTQVLARDSISGATTALPPGRELVRTIPIGRGVMNGPLEVDFILHSPAGAPATIRLDDRLMLHLPPTVIELSDLRLRVDQEVQTEPLILDLSGIDEEVSERVNGAAIELDVENPFDLSADLTLTITAPGVTVTEPLLIEPGNSTVRAELSEEEARAVLRQDEASLVLTGPAATPPEGSEVDPDQDVGFRVRLELIVAARRDS